MADPKKTEVSAEAFAALTARVDQLESDNDELRATVGTLAARALTGGGTAVLRSAADIAQEELRAAAAKKRAELKAATKKDDKWAWYRVGNQPYYGNGVTVAPGEVVRLPLSEEPSITWEPVDDDKPARPPPDDRATAKNPVVSPKP